MAEPDLQAQKRAIMHFFDRAEQCETVAPVAAYYTRLAGVTKGTSFNPMHPDIKAVCIAMMGALEKAKARIGITGPDGEPAAFEKSIGELRTFALSVFGNADRTDQLGARDNRLVLRYMAAGTFLQALATVYPPGLSPKETELLRYCRVRSVEISKAVRTGTEVPPPRAAPASEGGGDVDLDAELAALDEAPPPPRAPVPQGGGGGRFTESEAAAAAAKVAEAPVHVQSWDDMPSAPAHAPPPPVTDPLPKIFTRGAHILFKRDTYAVPQEGRIVNTHPDSATITTHTATAEAAPSQLAPYLPSGSEVMTEHPERSGRVVSGTVLRDTADDEWPPVYSVRLPDASTVDVRHSAFTAVSVPPGLAPGPQEPRSPIAAPPDAMPSVAATLPGVPKQNWGLAAPDVAPPAAAGGASSHYPAPARAPMPPQQPQAAYPAPAPPPQQAGSGYSSAGSGYVAQAPPPSGGYSGASYGPPQPAYGGGGGAQGGGRGGAFKQSVSLKDKEAAKKLAKQVVSALNFDDTKSAVDALRAALALLTE